jgi:hypothetical protein
VLIDGRTRRGVILRPGTAAAEAARGGRGV